MRNQWPQIFCFLHLRLSMEAEYCKRRLPSVGRVLWVSIQLTDVVVGPHLCNDNTRVKKHQRVYLYFVFHGATFGAQMPLIFLRYTSESGVASGNCCCRMQHPGFRANLITSKLVHGELADSKEYLAVENVL
jgi:hypothetical protein